MGKESLEMVGVFVLAVIWVFWRLGWNLENARQRWDALPLLERLMAASIMIGAVGP